MSALLDIAIAQPNEDLERALCQATNDLRFRHNLRPLVFDTQLSEIARGHSEEMGLQGYFSHQSPNQLCKTIADRLRFGHRFCLSSAENLHKSNGYDRSRLIKVAVQSWMDSPHHYRNLINPRFNRVGIGIVNSKGTYIFTQLFSFEPIVIQALDVVSEGQGFRVKVKAQVADGAREGGWFVDGKRRESWTADPDGNISAELVFEKPGVLEIGQLAGVRLWEIETSIPIPPPELHYRHTSSRDSLWPDFSRFF